MDGEPKQDLELLQGAIRLSSHVLTDDPAELAGQLIGRLIAQESPGTLLLLAQARATERGPWLCPYSASMIPPGGPLIRTLAGHTDEVSAVSVTPDGRRAVSGSHDKTLKVWDLETGRELRTLEGHAGSVSAVSVTPDGRRAVSGSHDKTLKVWDLEKGEEIASFSEEAGIVAIALGPGGKNLVAGDTSGRVHFLRLEGFDQ